MLNGFFRLLKRLFYISKAGMCQEAYFSCNRRFGAPDRRAAAGFRLDKRWALT